MLEEIRKTYLREASRIPNWESTSVNTLCNLYIDNEQDESLKSAYFSAIILKKWPYIGKHYKASKASGFSIEDCYDMVVHGIQYALEKRKWRDPNNKLYNDNCGPDKVLNRCIASSRDIEYYLSNTHKRRSNFGKTSLDMIQENVKDCTDIISDECVSQDNVSEDISISLLVDKLMKANKVLEALIINDLVQGDCFTMNSSVKKIQYEVEVESEDDDEDEEPKKEIVTEKVKSYSYNFKLSKLINDLYKYNEVDLRNICKSYCISIEKENDLINLFKQTKKNRFDRVIKETLTNMARDKIIRNHLCL